MAIVDSETLMKVTGNVGDEVPEAGYRLAASELAATLLGKTIAHLGAQNYEKDGADAATFLKFLGTATGRAVFGFALAAALELAPAETLMDERKRVAYNLRVQSYQQLGERLLQATGFLTVATKDALTKVGVKAA